MTLADTPVLLFDIQASAAASAGGTLLEVGWQPHPAPAPDTGIQTHIAAMPTAELPPRLARLTGLSADQMGGARPHDEIWQHLQTAAGGVAATRALTVAGAKNGMNPAVCPMVIHYKRFEAPYLAQLQANGVAAPSVYLDLICTHDIARRLLPGLPRKGLRAVAGFFGHDTNPLRRCRHHLIATGVIWKALADQLASHHGVDTLAELKTWIEETPAPRKGVRQFQVPRQMIRELPNRSGIYRFLSRTGKPLYVGKAKDLSQRVSTYFQPRRRHPEHILEMLSRVVAVKTTPTRTALEAALLEQDLIKRLAPPYNIALAPNAADLQFWSRDLTCQASQIDARRPWGPVPSGAPLSLLATLAQALASGDDDASQTLLRITLAETRGGTLDQACLAAGLKLFRHAHQRHLNRMPPGRALLAVGRKAWVKRGHDAKEATEAETHVEMPDTPPLWTPERVCRHLEHAACQAGALLRRSRWLTLLGNATLIWGLPRTDSGGYRELVFRKGLVTARNNLDSLEVRPPAKATAPDRCWHPSDRRTYDRLRVATTELRRLVQDRRPLFIVLSDRGGATLKRERVARLLGWL